MADMSGTPQIPAMEDVFGIIKKIYVIDNDAPGKIADHMLRAANTRRINADVNRDDPHLQRMAGFMHGAQNMDALLGVFTSAATVGKNMRQPDIDDLVGGISRYLTRNPDVARKVTFNQKESGLLENSSAPYRSDYTCNL